MNQDQATTLRSLMGDRDGDPFASLAGIARVHFLAPYRWEDGARNVIESLAERVQKKSELGTVLIVDGYRRKDGLERIHSRRYRIGLDRFESRIDPEIAEVIGLKQIWLALPYLEDERDLRWVGNQGSTVLLHGESDAEIVDAYRQLRALSGRCAVKKVDAFSLGPCDLRDTVRNHARLEEMGNRFLGLELGFFGKLKLNPERFLIHWNSGGELESQLEIVAQKFMLQPAQKAPAEMPRIGEVRP